MTLPVMSDLTYVDTRSLFCRLINSRNKLLDQVSLIRIGDADRGTLHMIDKGFHAVEMPVVVRFFTLHQRDQLAAFGLVDRIGEAQFARTVGEAVKRYVSANDVPWQDWQDRPDEADDPVHPNG